MKLIISNTLGLTQKRKQEATTILSHIKHILQHQKLMISINTYEYVIGNTTNNISPEIYAFDCHLYLLSMMRKQSFVHLNIRAMRPTLD